MRKALIAVLVMGALGLQGSLVAIVPAPVAAETPAVNGFPDSIVAVASHRGQAANPLGALFPTIAYMPIDAREAEVVLYVQNEAASEASIGVTFYGLNGSPICQTGGPLSGHGSLAYRLADTVGLPSGFAGSAVVTSTRSIHTLVNSQPLTGGGLLSYSGRLTGTEEIVLPSVLREYYGWNSTILVQNLGKAQAQIAVSYHPVSGGYSYVDNDAIPAGGTGLYAQQGMPELGTRFSGWAHIESNQPLVVVVQMLNSVTGQASAHNGLTEEGADDGFLVPSQYKNTTSGWVSNVQVSSLVAGSAAVTTTWRTSDGSEVWSQSRTGIPFGRPETYLIATIGALPDGLDGALRGVASQPVAAVNGLSLPAANDGFAMSEGTGLADAALMTYLPRTAHVLDQGLATAFSVQNASGITAATVMTFYHQSGSVTAVLHDSIAGNGFKRFVSTDVLSLGDDWEGSVVVAADRPVAVEVLQFLVGLPDIQVSPASLTTDLVQGGGVSLPLTIANDGDASLVWSLIEAPSAGWLNATPSGGTIPPGGHAGVTVSLDATGIAEGVYETMLQITSNDPDTPQVDVPVTMNVLEEFTVFLPLAIRDGRVGIGNGDFESGPTVWQQYSTTAGRSLIVSSDDIPPYIIVPHSGKWFAWLGGGYNQAATEYIQQSFYLPASTPYLVYWYEIWSQDSCGFDFGRVIVNDTMVDELDLCESQITDRWVKRVVDLSSYAGQAVSLKMQVETDSSDISNLYLDDVSLQSQGITAGGLSVPLDGE